MKVLVIGGGGREHSLVDAIHRSKKVTKIYAAPGNGGISELAECISLKVDDIEGIKSFVLEKAIDWTVIGPELPLTLGLADELRRSNLKCFGVNKDAAQLEGSKAFSKRLLIKNNIPTASYKEFTDYQNALKALESASFPIVIKADGLAAGKGVFICNNRDEASEALKAIFLDRNFGDSGDRVVIEDYLEGKEISAFAFSDGETVVPLIYAQDYKKAYEKDQGPNTGGMGSYTPVSFMTPELQDKVFHTVLKPTIEALKEEGIIYKGILYAGLMIQDSDIRVLEFNVRFGDPEAQVILPLLKTDIIDIFSGIESGKLGELKLEWENKSAVCVVLASEGYPGAYEMSHPISGLDKVRDLKGITLYHAGTKRENSGIISSGGRVLNVVAVNDSLREAYDTVYKAVDLIRFDNKYFRKDIALRELSNI